MGADLSSPYWLKIHLSHQQIFFFYCRKTNNHPSKNIPRVSDWVCSCGIGQDLYKIAPRILHLDAKVYSQVNDNVENFQQKHNKSCPNMGGNFHSLLYQFRSLFTACQCQVANQSSEGVISVDFFLILKPCVGIIV